MRLVVCAVLGGLAGCSPFGAGAFQCDDHADCAGGPSAGQCQATGFCSFADDSCASGQRYGSSSGPVSNACVGEEPTIDAPEGPPGDAACTVDGLELCGFTPGGPLVIGTSSTLNTDTDPRCADLAQPGGPEACLVYASAVTLQAGVTLRATGTRPLVIASTGAITIEGTLDASSQRGGSSGPNASFATGCAPATQPESDIGGAAGAAGGSFRGQGGSGGTGDEDDSLGGDGVATSGTPGPALGAAPAFARGGCAGGPGADEGGGGGGGGGGGEGGEGGASGGGVWLVANTSIDIPAGGVIRATGAGGLGGEVQAGGGGGGSGGYIRLAASAVVIAGAVSANGGAGGEGGCRCGGVAITGTPGGDGTTTASAAMGGTGASGPGGDGGASSSAASLAGGAGLASTVGAGGGGGGAGFVVIRGTATVTGVVSPPAQ